MNKKQLLKVLNALHACKNEIANIDNANSLEYCWEHLNRDQCRWLRNTLGFDIPWPLKHCELGGEEVPCTYCTYNITDENDFNEKFPIIWKKIREIIPLEMVLDALQALVVSK